MGEHTAISWTDHTFNPWWGCTRVSPGCDHCYAETFTKRLGLKVWGQDAPPRFFGDKHWAEPLKWNRDAEKAGVRRRVFCASMADVFEGRPEHQPHRLRLWRLIMDTPHLDWLLLTKRPGAVLPLLLSDAAALRHSGTAGAWAMVHDWAVNGFAPQNVWLGTTVEDQKRADDRIPLLLTTPATVWFLSCEPLLERVNMRHWLGACTCVVSVSEGAGMHAAGCAATMPRIDWVIVGGESGPGARPFDIAWARDILRQRRTADVACFVKQLGSRPVNNIAPTKTTTHLAGGAVIRFKHEGARVLADRKGADWNEWPADLRERAFPEVSRG